MREELSEIEKGRALQAGEVVPMRGPEDAVIVQQRVDAAHWSLGMALAWITYRTEQAVINSMDERLVPTQAGIRDLRSALRYGELIAHGMFEGERIPHQIETAVWSTFVIVVKG